MQSSSRRNIPRGGIMRRGAGTPDAKRQNLLVRFIAWLMPSDDSAQRATTSRKAQSLIRAELRRRDGGRKLKVLRVWVSPDRLPPSDVADELEALCDRLARYAEDAAVERGMAPPRVEVRLLRTVRDTVAIQAVRPQRVRTEMLPRRITSSPLLGDSPISARLEVVSGIPTLASIDVTDGMILGRRPGTGVALLQNPRVSARHARLNVDQNGLRVCDLGSTNGTMVDGRTLSPNCSASLGEGSILSLGDVQLRCRLAR